MFLTTDDPESVIFDLLLRPRFIYSFLSIDPAQIELLFNDKAKQLVRLGLNFVDWRVRNLVHRCCTGNSISYERSESKSDYLVYRFGNFNYKDIFTNIKGLCRLQQMMGTVLHKCSRLL